MIVECKNCGAPLDVDGQSRFVRCSYCQKTNRVRTMRTLHFERPQGWVPPPTWTPPPAADVPSVPLPRRQAPPPRRASIWMLVVLALIPLALTVFLGMWKLDLLDFLPSMGFEAEGEPQIRVVDLDQEADTSWLGGESGSWVELSSLDGARGCSGYVPRQPHLVLRTAHGGAVTIETQSQQDNVMLLVTSDGQYVCDDDSGDGFNAAISRTVPAGEHRVWVGSYSNGQSFPINVRVRAQAVDAPVAQSGLAPDASPSLGTLELSPGVTHSFEGVVEPFVDLSRLRPECRGFAPVGPHVAVRATRAERVRFVTRDNDEDLVMAVRTPDGSFHCDDDSGDGLNPRIDVDLTPGLTTVWVGTYQADETSRFTLDVGEPRGRTEVGSGVDPIAAPVLGTANLDVPGWSESYAGTTRAEVNERTHRDPTCRGWVGRAPDVTLLTTTPRTLTITVESRADLTLMLRGPDGAFVCDDDSGEGNAPRLRRGLSPGSHQLWVGRARGRRPAEFELSLREASP